jgi:hypothetical protein
MRSRFERYLPVIDPIRSISRSIYVSGSARSGTTWVCEMLCGALRARLVFEPLHHNGSIPSAPHFLSAGSGDEVLKRSIRQALTGALNDKKVNLFQRPGVFMRRVVKDIRPGLLSVIREVAPNVPVVFLVRHPIEMAVSCAELEKRDSANWWDADAALSELRRYADQDQSRLGALAAKCVQAFDEEPTELAKYVGIWCVENALALDLFPMAKGVVMRYEDLLTAPEEHFPVIEALCGARLPRGDRRNKPSRTTFRDDNDVGKLGKWRQSVNVNEAERLLTMTALFGLDSLYGTDPMVDIPPLNRNVKELGLG